jgi:hypothetical protein
VSGLRINKSSLFCGFCQKWPWAKNEGEKAAQTFGEIKKWVNSFGGGIRAEKYKHKEMIWKKILAKD